MGCSTCRIQAHCLPCGLSSFATTQFEKIGLERRKVCSNTALFRHGDSFTHVFAVRSGTLKSSVSLGDTREQVSGFHVPGEVVGLDAIAEGRHASSTTALEDSEVCAIPYMGIADLSVSIRAVQDIVSRLMSLQILRKHVVLLLLGSMNAEERLAAFLLDLSMRYAIRGYSPLTFHLRMTRADIGSYLGLQVETICRAFAALHRQGLVRTERKTVWITDLEGLRRRTDATLGASEPASRRDGHAAAPRPEVFPLDALSRQFGLATSARA